MSKTTVSAPANIAFIKYWGARDLDRAIPMNSSISMTLEHCVTPCTVETLDHGGEDEVWLAEPDGGFGTPDARVRPPGARRSSTASALGRPQGAGAGGDAQHLPHRGRPRLLGLRASRR